MSWENVKVALHELPHEGCNGFEGFVADLLSALLNQPFLVARKSDQPGGDARSFDGSVRLQAKHYTAGRIPDADIIADFHRVRLNCPSMDTYAIGTAFPINEQLRSSLDALETEFGIDIPTLEYSTELSSLSVLTITFWYAVCRFPQLASLDAAMHTWVISRAESNEIQKAICDLRKAFSQSIRLFVTLRNAAKQRLAERVGIVSGPSAGRFSINLRQAIARKSVRSGFNEWRTSNSLVFVLEGEEGMGKSWAAAACADEIAHDDGCAVIWMECHEWAGTSDLHQLIARAFNKCALPGVKELTKWQRKMEFIWPSRLYFFLDGANEDDALETAQTLVSKARTSAIPFPRLIFTTRPLARLHGFNKPVWTGISHYQVGPFNDEEFALALAALPSPLRREDIPVHLETWARIPRLLQTCASLRDKFGGFQSVTREMILWAELLNKIDQTDPQVRQTLGWRNDEEAAGVIAQLAQAFMRTGARDIGREQISASFSGNYENVLVALEELRLADKAHQMRTRVSADCNVLGLALLICERLRLPSKPSVRAEADEFRRFLEPLSEADERTQALFVALQLTAQSPKADIADIVHKRAALLLAWGTSHNAKVTPDKLRFWAGFDTLAYASFVETVFEESLSESAFRLMLLPLTAVFREIVRVQQALHPILRRWLLLTWPDSETTATGEVEREGHRLPVASTQPQLNLTLAAVAIISVKPRIEMLSDLALSRATLKHAKHTRMLPKQPTQESEREPHIMPLKSMESNFGALMRFGYTESVLPELQRLAQVHATAPTVIRGLQELTASLWLVSVPPELQLPAVEPRFIWKGVPAVQLLRERRRLYPEKKEEFHVQENDISHLAIRDDLPEMLFEDHALLRHQAELALESPELASRDRSMTQTDDAWDRSAAWLAKANPSLFLALTSRFREKAFNWPAPLRALLLVENYLHRPAELSSPTLLERAKEFWQQQPKPDEREQLFLAARLHILAFLNFTPPELTEWLEFAANDDILRREIAHHASNEWLRSVTPIQVAELACQKLFDFASEPAPDDACAFGHFDFWARLAMATTEPALQMFNRIREEFRQRQPSGDRRFHWLCLLFAFATESALEAELQTERLPNIFDRDGCSALWFVGRQLQPTWLNRFALNELLKVLPIDEVGKVAAANGDGDAFRQWGFELLERANEMVGNPPNERRYWGDFLLEFDQTGHVECRFAIVGIPKPTTESPQAFSPPAHSSLRDFFHDDTKERNEALALANSDYAEIDASAAAACFHFGGLAAVSQWRRQYPDDFLRLAKPVLSRAVDCPDRAFHLASLIHALLCNLLVIEPDEAELIYSRLMTGGMRVQCNTVHRVPQFYSALWNPNECGSPRHSEMRRRMLAETANEHEMMTLMIAAMANGGSAEAERLAVERIAASVASQRAIGVSALAWLHGDSNLKRLRDLENSDPVKWLRRHAAWAAEVNAQNAAAIRFYRRLLTERDADIASTMVTQLEPALTPTASFWRREVEYEVLANRQLDGRLKAILIMFWMSWRHRADTNLEIAGRKLAEWGFGENIRHLEVPKPFPFMTTEWA